MENSEIKDGNASYVGSNWLAILQFVVPFLIDAFLEQIQITSSKQYTSFRSSLNDG